MYKITVWELTRILVFLVFVFSLHFTDDFLFAATDELSLGWL